MALMGGIPLLFSSLVVLYVESNRHFFDLPLHTVLLVSTIGASILIGFALMPATIAAIVLGFYLQYWGLLPVFISYPIATLIGLGVSRLLIRFAGARPLQELPDLKVYVRRLEDYYFQMVIYLRLSPVLPFAMMNVFLASLPVKIWWYILGSMVGMLPRTLLFFWFGMNARDLWEFAKQPTLEGVWQLTPFVLVLLSLAGLVYIGKKVFREKTRVNPNI